ncbi:MAG: site-specific integrase [Acidobacteria bacterium]|nr:site-specific integrase [Acidobacteriota bacterium]
MGCVYRRGKVWWVKYARAGKAYYESSDSQRKGDAIDLLRRREGRIAEGQPVMPKAGKVTFDDAAADLLTDYQVNGRKSVAVVTRRVRKHLTPYFTGLRLADLTTPLVQRYVAHRQQQGVVAVRGPRAGQRIGDVSPAEINRELAILKRMVRLQVQAGLMFHVPHIPLLAEHNARQGFFEPAQLDAVCRHLPPAIVPVIRFAAITGWRIASEVLPLEWRNVDFAAGEVRLDVGTTKNGEGRVFPMTSELRTLLSDLHAAHVARAKAGQIVPWVFVRMVANGRGGAVEPRRITTFTKAWRAATRAAGCPGRVPHDLRRTAIRTFVRRGISDPVAMRLSGHKTRSVFDRYNITSAADLADAALKLDAGRAEGRTRAEG